MCCSNCRSSAGKGPKNFGRWGSLKDKRHNSQASLTSVNQRGTVRHSADSDSGTECVHTFQRAALYIFGEKSHMRVRLETNITLTETIIFEPEKFICRHCAGSKSRICAEDRLHTRGVFRCAAHEDGFQEAHESVRTELT